MERKIVIPGTLLGKTDTSKQGRGTFREGDNIYSSRLGLVEERSGYINVIPLSGVYDPAVGDAVIGVIDEASKMNWMVDIKAPYPAMLRVSELLMAESQLLFPHPLSCSVYPSWTIRYFLPRL